MAYNQNRIYRVFQLIKLMRTPPYRTKEQLAASIGCTLRSIYRYLELLEDLGFELQSDGEGRMQVVGGTLPEGLTMQETAFLIQLLQSAAPGHPMGLAILEKLQLEESGRQVSAGQIASASKARTMEQCGEAIANRKQLTLVGYASAHSGDIRDRLVEPVNFTEDFQHLSAFEVASGMMKLFKIDRITDAVVMPDSFAHAQSHVSVQSDCFGFAWRADQDARAVHLQLTLRAGLVLREEYPRAAEHLTETKDGMVFHAAVADYRAPGRFVRGWAGEVTALGDEGLLAHLAAESAAEA